MEERERYRNEGYALLKGVLAEDVAGVLLASVQQVVGEQGSRLLSDPRVAGKRSYELYGQNWRPMTTLHWGMTALMERIVGARLAPTYSYFRAYQGGDICHVHSDREASEHSISLTLGYADRRPWPLAIAGRPLQPEEQFKPGYAADFGGEPFREIPMSVGDAVAYQGSLYRHGRIAPNPNRWSAHLFLQWVDRDGPFGGYAFDGRQPAAPGDFIFPPEPAATR